LEGINLLDPACKVEFVITAQALKEGWDCSFAYVFCSLATVDSKKDVEHLLGRVQWGKAASSHPKAPLKPCASQPLATHKPPSGYPKATPRLPTGYLQATLRLQTKPPKAPLWQEHKVESRKQKYRPETQESRPKPHQCDIKATTDGR
jgi:hypothetical protein